MSGKMKNAVLILFCILSLACPNVFAVRVGDISEIRGVRDNQLFGIGLVLGLNKTGDSASVTRRVISNLLKTQYLQVSAQEVTSGNVALVTVTATLPPFVRNGGKIDVTVASIGDAKSLFGGVLLQTPLQGADGEVYAVAQGPVTIGGFGASGEAARVEKNHPTVGRIPEGALVEQEVPAEILSESGHLCLTLKEQDFTTAQRIENVVNHRYPRSAAAVDSGSVLITIPSPVLEAKTLTGFVSTIQNLEVEPHVKARVVINERTGTIVAGEHVKIGVVAISHGNLSVYIKESPRISQPLPYSKGETVVVPDSEVEVAEEGKGMMVIEGNISVAKVAEGLNALGVSSRDLVAIFQAIQKAGALYADLVVL